MSTKKLQIQGKSINIVGERRYPLTFLSKIEALSALPSSAIRKATKFARQRYWVLRTKQSTPPYYQLERIRLAADLSVPVFYNAYIKHLLTEFGHLKEDGNA